MSTNDLHSNSSASASDENNVSLSTLFPDTDDAKPRAALTCHTFQRDNGAMLTIELIGHHSLWSHCLWNAGVALARYIDANPSLVRGKSVVELGCGAALPSLISYLQGSSRVLCTEYPDPELLQVLQHNIDRLVALQKKARADAAIESQTLLAQGLRWDQQDTLAAMRADHASGYDILILSDLLFNHSQHRALLTATTRLSHPHSLVLVAFSHHRPKFIKEDLDFFRMASEEFQFHVQLQDTFQYEPMFKEDPGDPSIRSQVYFYTMTRQDPNKTQL